MLQAISSVNAIGMKLFISARICMYGCYRHAGSKEIRSQSTSARSGLCFPYFMFIFVFVLVSGSCLHLDADGAALDASQPRAWCETLGVV
jgi:hypothetical protein